MANAIEVKVVREVDMPALMGRELRAFLEDVMMLAVENVSQPGRVPIDTGRLRDSLAPGAGVTMVDKASVPTFARVGSNVVYAGPLEGGDHLYRGGPSKGQPIKGWLSSTVQHVAPDIDALLEDMAASLEEGWGK